MVKFQKCNSGNIRNEILSLSPPLYLAFNYNVDCRQSGKGKLLYHAIVKEHPCTLDTELLLLQIICVTEQNMHLTSSDQLFTNATCQCIH